MDWIELKCFKWIRIYLGIFKYMENIKWYERVNWFVVNRRRYKVFYERIFWWRVFILYDRGIKRFLRRYLDDNWRWRIIVKMVREIFILCIYKGWYERYYIWIGIWRECVYKSVKYCVNVNLRKCMGKVKSMFRLLLGILWLFVKWK